MPFKVHRDIKQFNGAGLVIGGTHADVLQLSYLGSQTPAHILRTPNDFYTIDLRANSDIQADAGGKRLSKYLRESGRKFDLIVFERTTDLYYDEEKFIKALRLARQCLAPHGVVLIWNFCIEPSEQIRQVFAEIFNIQVSYENIALMRYLANYLFAVSDEITIPSFAEPYVNYILARMRMNDIQPQRCFLKQEDLTEKLIGEVLRNAP